MTIHEAYEVGRRNGRGEHNLSSPETRERLVKLETNHNNMMSEVQEIKQMIKELTLKVDCAMEKKADKTVVDGLEKDMKDLQSWKYKMIGIGIIVVFIIIAIKDYILGKL